MAHIHGTKLTCDELLKNFYYHKSRAKQFLENDGGDIGAATEDELAEVKTVASELIEKARTGRQTDSVIVLPDQSNRYDPEERADETKLDEDGADEVTHDRTPEPAEEQEGEQAECGEIQAGREAWAEEKANAGRSRERWLKIGRALQIGRDLHASNRGFSEWCLEHGFDDLHRNDRTNAMWLANNWEEVQATLHGDRAMPSTPGEIRRAFNKAKKGAEKGADGDDSSPSNKEDDGDRSDDKKTTSSLQKVISRMTPEQKVQLLGIAEGILDEDFALVMDD
ncbi:hypothetical protein RDV64_12015 [Acuticoccus sp. MNP-M23]|uniref:hypothetical protein n=1 Tax=Acuticoccus sp. MNP-M23 TaxID=3072793 RepID=UPI0028165166|nr:hypothetical protein [Acuticoccus sp. MNP-M23]WMS40826.1 hypothetical protein RDV64_12015 [Acuticoccus sp. MNP-M23]